MTASIWDPTQTFIPAVNASLSLVFEKFTASAAQSLFTLSNFNYTLGTNSLVVMKDGDLLVPGIDYDETSVASFTLTAPCVGGEKISCIGFTEISANVTVPQDGSVTALKLSASFVLPIAKGGTGATTAAGALTALGAMPLAGGVFTGPVTLDGDAASALEPTTLQQVQALLAGASESAVWDFESRQLNAGADFFFTY